MTVSPLVKREEKLFDEWSLKDMLIHLWGWSKHQIEVLGFMKKGKAVSVSERLKNSINQDLVKEKQKESWDRIYKDFLEIGSKLEKEYTGLPYELWSKKIWPNKGYTPKSYLQIEIDHYFKTHGPQVQKVLKYLS